MPIPEDNTGWTESSTGCLLNGSDRINDDPTDNVIDMPTGQHVHTNVRSPDERVDK